MRIKRFKKKGKYANGTKAVGVSSPSGSFVKAQEFQKTIDEDYYKSEASIGEQVMFGSGNAYGAAIGASAAGVRELANEGIEVDEYGNITNEQDYIHGQTWTGAFSPSSVFNEDELSSGEQIAGFFLNPIAAKGVAAERKVEAAEKEIAKEMERVNKANRDASVSGTDQTQYQITAKYGKRFEKGTKEVKDGRTKKLNSRNARTKGIAWERAQGEIEKEALKMALESGMPVEEIQERMALLRKRDIVDSDLINYKSPELSKDEVSKLVDYEMQSQAIRNTPGLVTELKHGGQMKESIPVEVEQNELIFRKKGNRWKLVQDHGGGKKHEEGGEDTYVQEGDVVFPANKRKKVMEMLDKNGTVLKIKEPDFEAARMALPTDTDENGEAAEGFNYEQAIGYGSQLAPILYNLSESKKPARKETRRYYKPDSMDFIDTSQESINAVNRNYKTALENVSKNAGGSSGSVLANQAQLLAKKNTADSAIRANKAKEAQRIENMNTRIGNRAKFVNTRFDIDYDTKDAMNEAARQKAKAKAISQVSDVGQNYYVDSQARNRDANEQEMQDFLMDYYAKKIGYNSGREFMRGYNDTELPSSMPKSKGYSNLSDAGLADTESIKPVGLFDFDDFDDYDYQSISRKNRLQY